MKTLHHIVLCVFLLAMASCSRYARESQRIKAAFEQAQQVYGDGENDTLLFIPELDKASAYYARKKDFGKAALSALYQGYAEKDYDKVLAMEAFKDAERYGELIGDSLTMARAEYQMGRMLYYDYMHNEALALYGKSDVSFGNHYSERVLALNGMACCYIHLESYEKADSCLSRSLYYAELDRADGELKQKVLNNYAVLCQVKGEYDMAVDYLKMIRPMSDQQKVLNLLNLGDVFMEKGVLDSAAFYYNQMEEFLDEARIKDETKASAYYSLSLLSEYQGDYHKALECQKYDIQYVVKVKDKIEKKNVFRIQQQYDYESLRNVLNEKIIIRQYIILVLFLLVMLVLSALALTQRRLAKIQNAEIESNKRTMFYVQQYSNLLIKQGKTMQKLALVIENKEDLALVDNLRATVFGKKDPWDALMDVFDLLHPNERERIYQKYSFLTEMEHKDLILSYFNVSRQDEAIMFKTSIHSIDKLRLSVRRKTHNFQE